MKYLLFVLILAMTSVLHAEQSQQQNTTAAEIELGISAEAAIELLGTPDSETEIGAACGMLQVLTWGQEKTRVIISEGKVTSVTDSQ